VTLKRAVDFINAMIKKHGEEVKLYFDCPHCKQSFSPDFLEAKAIHLTGGNVNYPSLDKESG